MDPEWIMKWMPAKARENQEFDLTLLLLKRTGMLPPTGDEPRTRLDRFLKVALPTVVMIGGSMGTVFMPLGALMSRDDLATLFECACISSLHITSVFKIWYVSTRPEAFKEFTSRVVTAARNDRYARDDQNVERQTIVNKVQAWINLVVVGTFFCIASFNWTFISRAPSLFGGRKQVARIWFPIDPYASPTYEILFIVWHLNLFLMSAASCCLDGYLGAVLISIIGQLKLLCYDMMRIREDAVEHVRRRREKIREQIHRSLRGVSGSNAGLELGVVAAKDSEKVEVDEEMHRLLKECVYRYQECGKIVQEAESLLELVFMQGVLNTLFSLLGSILFAGVDPGLPQGITDAAEIEKHRAIHQATIFIQLGIVMSVCGQLFACCLLVNMIVDASELVRDAAYGCDWVAATEAFKRSIRIVISRANQPMVISVAGFVPLTLETYVAIMNLAYSYYTAMSAAVQ